MTVSSYEGATPQQLSHPMVRELLAVHNMFRGQLQEILRYTDALLAGGARLSKTELNLRYDALARAAYQYTEMLHHHHSLETAALFPSLQKKGLQDDIVARLVADHDEIANLITQLDTHLADAASRDLALVDADLRRLSAGLRAHLAYEEEHTCPFIALLSGWDY